METLEKYEPKVVLSHFAAISKIPRGSGNEKAVSDYIAEFARSSGADVVQDKWNNLIIKKPASKGCEAKAPVILQAHLDMVCEKNAGTAHDFTRDPIDLYVDGDYIKARGTTLGADNGIGVAMCMAVLESETAHPPLEILLTTEEETGMDGAENLDISQLKGERIINLDTSNDDLFTMGCAAGTTSEFIIPADWTSGDFCTCEIFVKGLHGGHSGADIEKERGNALRILGFLLEAANSNGTEIGLAKVEGGMKVNAIPREASATITFAKAAQEKIAAALEKNRENFKDQFRASDPDLKIEWSFDTPPAEKTLTPECTQKVISALILIPTGKLSESLEIEGLVNSSCNMGVAETTQEHIKISAMPRGAAEYLNRQTEAQISAIATYLGAEVNFMQRSPAWPYNPDSALLKTALSVFKKMFDREADVAAVHAGLECGIFSQKFAEKNIKADIISFGANSYDYHTPDEKLSISSVKRAWEFLCALIKEL